MFIFLNCYLISIIYHGGKKVLILSKISSGHFVAIYDEKISN